MAVQTARLQPVPRVLSDHDIPSIAELNRRIEAVVYAHQRQRGRRVSPGLAYDLVRLPLADHEYQRMLRVDPTYTRVRSSLRYDTGDLADQLGVIPVGGPTTIQPRQYGPMLGNPITAPITDAEVRELQGAYRTGRLRPTAPVSQAAITENLRRGYLLQMGVLSGFENSGLQLFGEQIISSIEGMPGGIAYMGQAVGLDIRDIGSELIRHTAIRGLREAGLDVDLKHRDITPGRSVQLAKDSWTGFQAMVEDPLAHPGDWFILGIGLAAGPVVGTAARISAAGKVLAETGSKSLAASRFVMGPPRQSFALGVGTFQARIPLSQNVLWRELYQKPRLGQKQAALERRQGPRATEAAPDFSSAPKFGDFRGAVRWLLSPERTLERGVLRRTRIETAIRLAPINEVEKFTRWSTSRDLFFSDVVEGLPWLKKSYGAATNAVGKLPGFRDRSTVENRAAIEKAIEVLATDDPDPLAAHRDFHARQIVTGVGYAKAHEAQLNLLNLAEKILDNPPKELFPLFEAIRRMTDAGEELKAIYSGVDRKNLSRRIALHGAVLRGHLGDIAQPITSLPGKQVRAEAQKKLRKLDKELAALGKIAERQEAEFRLPTQIEYVRVRNPMTDVEVDERLNYLNDLRQQTLDYLSHLERGKVADIRRGRTGTVTPEDYMRFAGNVFMAKNAKWPDSEYQRLLGEVGVTSKGRHGSWKQAAEAHMNDMESRVGQPTEAPEFLTDAEVLLQRLIDGPGVNPDVRLVQDMMRERKLLQDIVAAKWTGLEAPEAFKEDVAKRLEPDPYDPDIARETDRRIKVVQNAMKIAAGMAPGRIKNKRLRQQSENLARDVDPVKLAQELETLRTELDRMGATDPFGPELRAQTLRVERLQGDIANLQGLLDARANLELAVDDPMDRATYAQGYKPFYFPSASVERETRFRGRPPRSVSQFGVKSNVAFDDLDHEFTGTSMLMGNTRVDISTLNTRSVRKAVHVVKRIDMARGAWDAGRIYGSTGEVPDGFIPIRTTDKIPKKFRHIFAEVDDGSLSESAWGDLNEQQIADLDRWIFPPVGELTPMDFQNGTVRFVEERFVVWKKHEWDDVDRTLNNGWAKLMFVPNEIMRLTNLFLRPAYALNALGAQVMATIQQGFLAPAFLLKAIHAGKIWGRTSPASWTSSQASPAPRRT